MRLVGHDLSRKTGILYSISPSGQNMPYSTHFSFEMPQASGVNIKRKLHL